MPLAIALAAAQIALIFAGQDGPTIPDLAKYGPLGVMVMMLAWVAWRKDAECRQLYRERIDAEQKFREQKVELVHKYREGLEQLNKTLDALLRMFAKINGGRP